MRARRVLGAVWFDLSEELGPPGRGFGAVRRAGNRLGPGGIPGGSSGCFSSCIRTVLATVVVLFTSVLGGGGDAEVQRSAETARSFGYVLYPACWASSCCWVQLLGFRWVVAFGRGVVGGVC